MILRYFTIFICEYNISINEITNNFRYLYFTNTLNIALFISRQRMQIFKGTYFLLYLSILFFISSLIRSLHCVYQILGTKTVIEITLRNWHLTSLFNSIQRLLEVAPIVSISIKNRWKLLRAHTSTASEVFGNRCSRLDDLLW